MKIDLKSITYTNVASAFTNECIAVWKYNLFATIAQKEGLNNLYSLFQELSLQESEHAEKFYNLIKNEKCERLNSFPISFKNDNSIDNLKDAIHQEIFEYSSEYKTYADIAHSEGYDEVCELFKNISIAEHFHSKRLSNMLESIMNSKIWNSSPIETLWVCSKCGYVHKGTFAPEECPLCEHKRGYFKNILANNL